MSSPVDVFSFVEKVDIAEFASMFSRFQKSACRLELLESYSIDMEKVFIDQYARTGACDASYNAEWQEILKAATLDGKVIKRLRGIPKNNTSLYIQFEMTCAYPNSIKCGEKVRFIELERVLNHPKKPDILLDFWVFDGRDSFLMFYDFSGVLLGVGRLKGEMARIYQDFFDAVFGESEATMLYNSERSYR